MKYLIAEGKQVAVDDDVYEWASQHTWRLFGKRRNYVARLRWVRGDGRYESVYLHRLITNAPAGMTVDHINHDTFDCRRQNLRLATYGQNNQNKQGAQRGNPTGLRNVYANQGKGYLVRLKVNGQNIDVGRFATLEEAAQAAAEARRRYMTHAPECEAVPTTDRVWASEAPALCEKCGRPLVYGRREGPRSPICSRRGCRAEYQRWRRANDPAYRQIMANAKKRYLSTLYRQENAA